MDTTTAVQSHKELLTDLLLQLETEERPFYELSSGRNYRAWHLTAGISFLSSVASALAASVIDASDFQTYGKVLLVVIPIVGAGATGLLHLYKFREKEALREEGRIALNDIIANAKSQLASANNEEDFKKAYLEVRQRASELEYSQHRRDIALRSDEIPRVRP